MLRTKKEVDRHVRELLNKIKSEDERKSRGYNIARFYFNVDEYESARRYLAEFISCRPRSSDAHKLMGQIYEKLGLKEKAIQYYKTAYSISDNQKDLVPKICGLFAEMDADPATRAHWAEEGERLFPHHNNVINLRQSLMMADSSQSKEEQEKFYFREIKANPLSLGLHVKLARLFLDWGKEQPEKYEEALNYVIGVEARRPFPHALEWYQIIADVFKVYETWKRPRDCVQFEELHLSILDRYVFESLASSCGPALSSLCSMKEAAERLQMFGARLMESVKILGGDSTCSQHMIAQYYFHLALLISIRAKNESILHKNIYVGCLLLHSVFLVDKAKFTVSGSDDREALKRHWLLHSYYRLSQCGHFLNQLARSFGGQKGFIKKIQEICSHRNTPNHIHNMVFESSSGQPRQAALFQDQNFMKKTLKFVDHKTQLLCDQEVIVLSSNDLREMVWLFLQYSHPLDEAQTLNYFKSFDLFRSVPFASSMNTIAPETLCHLDLIAFIVAVALCRQCNADVCVDDTSITCPSILADHLYTPEQGEWWNAASALCSNKGSKSLDRFRAILQSGLESIRHLGHHILPPIQLTLHLARYFTTWISEARAEGISVNEIYSLEERAEHYWSRVVSHCSKKAKGILGTGKSKSKLFDIRNGQLSEEDYEEIREDGELFIADCLDRKGKREEAIQILSRLKTPKASFNRAMLYKKQAQSLLGNRTWQSISLSARKEYITLLTQSRDALYLTLDRLKMPGVDLSNPLNTELPEELTSIEHCLSSVTLDDYSASHSDDDLGDLARHKLHADLDLTNGNASANGSWMTPSSDIYQTMYSTPISHSRTVNRQEARPSSERLDAQLRHLTDIQQNTIKNIEEHNVALRSQNETLLQTCQTMMNELKDRYLEHKNPVADTNAPIVEYLKQLESSMKNLQLDVKSLSSEISEMKKVKISQAKPEPLQILPVGASNAAADGRVPIDLSSPALHGVYNNYMGFCGQQAVRSPLTTHPAAIFNPCQPPFMPPTTLQDQAYLYPSTADVMKIDPHSQPPMVSAATLYQQPGSIMNQLPTKKTVPQMPVSSVPQMPISTVPPHSYQITLPMSNPVSYTNVMPASDDCRSDTVFSTVGLLSNVPPPVYSAISTYHSPDKSAAKNVFNSSATPITQAIPATVNFSSPQTTSGQRSSAFPPGPVVKILECTPNQQQAFSPNRSANDSDHYVDDGHDPCPDFKPIIPLPAQVELITGEEDENILFEERVKLFRFCDKEWKERGIGPIKILHNTKQGTVRILMRREQTHKICSNHLITPTMELSTKADSDKVWMWAAQDFADEKLIFEKFCCKFKSAELAECFQKAFYEGRRIAEATERAKESQNGKSMSSISSKTKSTQKPFSELFKPDPGSWTCDVCLVINKKEAISCASCQTPKPGFAVGTPTLDAANTKEESKVSFKFGISSSSTPIGNKPDSQPEKSALTFGTPTSKSEVIVVAPVASVSAATNIHTFGSGGSINFGPNSSVSISPVIPGSSPGPSLFKNNAVHTGFATVQSATSISKSDVSTTKEASNKFSIQGFTFSKAPSTIAPKVEEKEAPSVSNEEEASKNSIFSNFSFVSSKSTTNNDSKGAFTFNLSASVTSASTATTSASSTSVPAPTVSGGIFSGTNNSGSVASFGSLATGQSDNDSMFKTKDESSFKSRPLFGKAESEAKLDTSSALSTSKDDVVEEYEPQVDFKPVIPMPDLVEVKTGEEAEDKMFCARTKLYRFDASAKEWKERGVGEIKILKDKDTNKARVLMRRDQTHKVCANHLITRDQVLSTMSSSDKSWVWAANDFADEEMKIEKFAVRFKTTELANEFKCSFEEAQKLVEVESSKAKDPSTLNPTSASSTAKSKPLSEMFKPAVGSWECSVCLVMNSAVSSSCVSCATPKDGLAPTQDTNKESSVFGDSSYAFKNLPSAGSGSAFTFGVSTTATSTASSNPPAFTFGLQDNNATPQKTVEPSATTSKPTNQPFTFTWNPQDALVSKTSASGTPSSVPCSSSGFSFGSPGKHEFSFSGIKSPRSRDTSTCESENGVEEEEDNLYFEPVVSLPDKIDVVTGEEDETVLFEHRSKLFRLRDGEFKERGLGDVKILQHNQTKKIRLLMRREHVHKICLNHYLKKELEFHVKDDKSFYWVTSDFSESDPTKDTFAIRFKTPEIASTFIKAIQESKELIGSSSLSPVKISTTTSSESTPSTTVSQNIKSEDLEIIFEKKATADQVSRARKLLLPDNFYLYEDKEPCPGCIGCSDDKANEVLKSKTPSKTSDDKSLTSSQKNLFGSPLLQSSVSQPSTISSIFGLTPSFSFGSAPGTTNALVTQPSTPSQSIFGGNTPAPSIFGGNTPTTSIFGGNTPTTSIFGGNTPTTSIFGGNTGSSTPTTGSIFGGNVSTTNSIFGGNTSSKSLFGNTSVTSTENNTKKDIFSSPSQGGVSFGDLAKQSTESSFNKAKGHAAAWVSKPLFGAKSPEADTAEGDDDYDPHYDPVVPMPELVKVTTGEEGWDEMFSQRSKVYRYEEKTKEWKERGIGDFKIQFEPNLNKYRFLQRREQVHKLSCNHYLTPNIQLDPMSSSETAWCWLAMDFSEKPEGEPIKLAVKFKTKEMAVNFKSVYDSCIAKMASSSVPPSGRAITVTSTAVIPPASVSEAEASEDEPEHYEDEEYEDIDEADNDDYDDDDDDDDEDDDDEERVVMFAGRCEISVESDRNWMSLGPVELKIVYDDDAYGARIIASSAEGDETLLDSLIAIQTTVHPSGDLAVTWTSFNDLNDPPKKVQVKAAFDSKPALRKFVSAFEEGKDYAFNSGIEETTFNDVPESELYYGQAYEG